jgi:hypothetical protein
MYILDCIAFDEEKSARHRNECCKGDCHERGTLINVTPYASDATLENRSIDWSLGIQGYVCCGRYEFVRSLSREWWIRKLAQVDGWDEERLRSALHPASWHRVFATNRSQGPSKIQVKVKVKTNLCPNCGSDWNEIICEECGHAG